MEIVFCWCHWQALLFSQQKCLCYSDFLIPENTFVLVICFRCKLLYQSACGKIKPFFIFSSVHLNPTCSARCWNQRGFFLLGSLWEEMSHPSAQRLLLILLFFYCYFFKWYLWNVLATNLGNLPCISVFCFSCFLPWPQSSSTAVPGYPGLLFCASSFQPHWMLSRSRSVHTRSAFCLPRAFHQARGSLLFACFKCTFHVSYKKSSRTSPGIQGEEVHFSVAIRLSASCSGPWWDHSGKYS